MADGNFSDDVRLRIAIVRHKTGRPVPFEVFKPPRETLAAWLKLRGLLACRWPFPSRSRSGEPPTTRQYDRPVDQQVALIGLAPAGYGTRSLHRAKLALIYQRMGSLTACQLLLDHTKLYSSRTLPRHLRVRRAGDSGAVGHLALIAAGPGA